MYTSIMGVALAAFVSANSLAPAWHNSYRQARDLGEKERKPIVVVIGSGKTPWANLTKAAEQDESINLTLRTSYVCLFVDTDTTEGQTLARSFDMSQGLVISDKSGEVQAFRHAGEIPAGELAKTLTTHANGEIVIRKAPVQAQPVYYPSFGGDCPSCRRGW